MRLFLPIISSKLLKASKKVIVEIEKIKHTYELEPEARKLLDTLETHHRNQIDALEKELKKYQNVYFTSSSLLRRVF